MSRRLEFGDFFFLSQEPTILGRARTRLVKMPSIDVAMTRSLRGGFSGIVARSFQHAFQERNIITDAQDQISDVKTAFSSWDNCMQVVYCKYGHPFLFALLRMR